MLQSLIVDRSHPILVRAVLQKNLPTVKTLQAEDCLQMAMQSLVTEVSGCVRSPRLLQPSEAEHTTVVPAVFSYVSTPPKHCPDTQESMLRMRPNRAVGSRWFQRFGLLRCRWKRKKIRVRVGYQVHLSLVKLSIITSL